MGSRQFIDVNQIAHQAMANYGFISRFPSKVLKEVAGFKEALRLNSLNHPLKDLKGLLWSSIDNIESQDLDQLEYCQRLPNREIKVMIAIADVDHYVTQGCPTDQHASHNGTSVYTGFKVFPMIPERLSTDFSSLKEGEERLAIIIEFYVKKDGSVRHGEVYQGIVHNKAKLVYESVGDWLEGQGPLPEKVSNVSGLKDQLILQDEAAQRLKSFRIQNGALEFETIEAKPIIKQGEVRDLVVKKKNRARYLIENFMVAANGTMVKFLEEKGSAYIQRIVRTPERWERICEVAQSLGDSLPPEPDAKALSDFLAGQRQSDPEHFPDLSLTIVKLLGPGEYVLKEPQKSKLGHFGLAVYDYTHSTAPNRRYVDVIIQRLIKATLSKETIPYSKARLQEISQWCTLRDKAAKKVERFMRKVAGAVLLRDSLGKIFEAIVTGASEKGTYVRLLSPPVEGRVIRGEKGMDVGEKVRVRLINLEPENGYIDFERARR